MIEFFLYIFLVFGILILLSYAFLFLVGILLTPFIALINLYKPKHKNDIKKNLIITIVFVFMVFSFYLIVFLEKMS